MRAASPRKYAVGHAVSETQRIGRARSPRRDAGKAEGEEEKLIRPGGILRQEFLRDIERDFGPQSHLAVRHDVMDVRHGFDDGLFGDQVLLHKTPEMIESCAATTA